uniref:Glomulin, FKBP associated protein b n=1 Tax=Amphilophus citrinellus TaxID=61819 RepID=A0A3Q0SE59_AMPCI
MNKDQVIKIIQRWRNTEEQDLKPEDYQQFENLGSACLAEGESEQLLKFIQDEKHQSRCKQLVPVMTRCSPPRASAEMSHLFLKTCRPNELLHSMLELVEGIDPGAISETILALLPHLQTALLRLDEGRAACVGSALRALQEQLSRLPVPYTEQQEEADEHGLCRCCAALTAFTKPFVEELKRKDGNTTAEDEELRTELLKFCMRSLREPLLEAELNPDRKSPLWLFAVEIMVTLPAIREPLSGLLFFSSLRKNTPMDSSQFKEARACLAYLLFVQLITIDSFPAVFSHVFILQCNMDYINQLLSRYLTMSYLSMITQALFTTTLKRVQDSSLPVSLLDLRSFCRERVRHLLQVMNLLNVLLQRESGLQLFQLLINKLEAEAKHKFFRCMLKTSNHAGVESYIIKNIRNQFEFSTKVRKRWRFLGAELISLLRLVLCLPQGADTDLLSSMDRVMESLNLLRYVLIRDKELRTNVWEELCRLKDEYIKMLRVCIGISRAYYSSELKALREDQKLKAREARDAARSLASVKGLSLKHEKVSSMSPEVQQQVLQSALVTFDLMESLIVRIEEITEEKLNKLN